MTNAKWLIALDMANVLMGNVFVPEDTQDHPASKVRKGPSINFFWEENSRMNLFQEVGKSEQGFPKHESFQ